MKETGIIMSGNHPQLILDLIKTQTRRVIVPQPPLYCDAVNQLSNGTWNFYKSSDPDFHAYLKKGCPYGQVGGRLWVRETYSLDWWHAASMVVYKADLKQEDIKRGYLYDPVMKEDTKLYWKPSIFMPKWAARIWLEITGVRVERVQEISAWDAMNEGLETGTDIITRFHDLWDSLNAKRGHGWDVNPFVWVISFQKLD